MVKRTSKATSGCGLIKQLTASLLNSLQLCFSIMAQKLQRITMFSLFAKPSVHFSKYICSYLILSLESLSLGLGSVALVLFHRPFSSRPQNCLFPSVQQQRAMQSTCHSHQHLLPSPVVWLQNLNSFIVSLSNRLFRLSMVCRSEKTVSLHIGKFLEWQKVKAIAGLTSSESLL